MQAVAATAPAVDLQALANTLVQLDEQSAVSVMSAVLNVRPELADPIVKCCVPDLTYPPSKMLTERRGIGTVKNFSPEKGFGFIDCRELKEIFGSDVFVHYKQMQGHDVGTQVSFAVALSKDGKPQAYDVVSVDPDCKGKGKGKGEAASFPPSVGITVNIGGGVEFDGCSGGDGGCGVPPPPPPLSAPGVCTWNGGEKRSYGQAFGGGTFHLDVKQELGQFMGLIKSFNEKNGYGFISCPDLQQQGYAQDVWVHHVQVAGCTVGGQVVFTAFLTSKDKLQAKDVRPVEDFFGTEVATP